MESLANIGIIVSYILIVLAVGAALLLPLIYFVRNFDLKKAKGSFIGLGVLLAIFLISFATSSGEAGEVVEKFGISTTTFKIIGGSIVMTYILIVAAFLIAVYTEATNRIK